MATRARRPRAGNAARRSLQMVEATLRSVARNGLGATTLASVSAEAGLSQGVAVFYFESKDRLLAAAFRHHYEVYRRNWQGALEAAPAEPGARLAAVLRADFAPAVFNREALAVWYAYWGEATARPLYADISKEFDGERLAVLTGLCAEATGEPTARAAHLAAAVDALTDGLWLRAHLADRWEGPAPALSLAAAVVSRLLPGAGEAVAARLTQPSEEGA